MSPCKTLLPQVNGPLLCWVNNWNVVARVCIRVQIHQSKRQNTEINAQTSTLDRMAKGGGGGIIDKLNINYVQRRNVFSTVAIIKKNSSKSIVWRRKNLIFERCWLRTRWGTYSHFFVATCCESKHRFSFPSFARITHPLLLWMVLYGWYEYGSQLKCQMTANFHTLLRFLLQRSNNWLS